MINSKNRRGNLKYAIFLLLSIVTLSLRAQESNSDVWPKVIKTKDFLITLYSPEDESYLDNQLVSYLAFSIKKENNDPVFGVLWVTSYLDVDRTSRQASLATIKINEIRFPDEISEKEKQEFESLINTELPKWNIEFPLDDMINGLDEVSVILSKLNNNPPRIIFKNEPTALIQIDGEPVLKEVEKGFELVENTGAFIIKSKETNLFYLRGGEFWYQSKAVLGPWESTEKVPSKVKSIAKKAESKNEGSRAEAEEYKGYPPKIEVVYEPSELIVISGKPSYSPLQNTNLLFIENTDSDVFMHVTTQSYFLLISGRWFTTKDLNGDWEFIESEKLPEDFKKIGSDSKKANVLSNVAGTVEAKNAVYDAQIPQTAAVKRDTKANEVVYNGAPEFKNVEGLNLQYALNTESDVFKDDNIYYLCDNAVWFTSTSPNGPWKVADDRPNDIEKIPAENPKYNTKYVYIYETSPTVVYTGYTPGYYGSYVYGPTVVYGTGFYYNPWYNGYYYHHHYSYGFSMRYNPWYGWSFGFGFGSPYFWYGHSYWGWGYHHWGPPYYRPPYYGGNNRPRPSHPIYKGRGGVSDYTRPGKPSNLPATRPSNRPSTRPSTQPTARPSTMPSTRPSTQPALRPSTQPSTRPGTQPALRPSQPSARPSTRPQNRPGNMPNMRPSTMPSRPSYRPAPRPSPRPTARPMPMNRPSGGMRRR